MQFVKNYESLKQQLFRISKFARQTFEEVTDYLSLHPFENINTGSSYFTAIDRFIVMLNVRT